jgi:subtilisin family serine protease
VNKRGITIGRPWWLAAVLVLSVGVSGDWTAAAGPGEKGDASQVVSDRGDVTRTPLKPAPSPLRHVPGELLVRFKEGTLPTEARHAFDTLAATSNRHFTSVPGLYRVTLGADLPLDQALRVMGRNPDVLYAEPNYVVDAHATPNDPSYSAQWGLRNNGQTGGMPGADIAAEDAWNVTTGSHGVVVAVIDTGVDYNHQDLAANVFRNEVECTPNGLDDDGNGYVDDCHGIDVVNGDSDPMDDHDHGTHVAGIIGAVGNNAIGVAGVNWNVSVLPCKFLDATGHGSTADAVTCLDYVAAMKNRGVDIVASNNSWGGGLFSWALRDAIRVQQDLGILFVASAGNSGLDNDRLRTYPCSYDVPNVLCVAASDADDHLAAFSNFGRATVDLSAPGVDILSTTRGNTYQHFNGTSMAAPHVAGMVALLRAENPARDWKEAKNLILSSGDASPYLGATLTGRRLNAGRALACSGARLTARLAPERTEIVTGLAPVELSVLNLNCAAPGGPPVVHVSGGPGAGDVALVDDGVGRDQFAGDGVYTGTWTPAAAGLYLLDFPDGSDVGVRVDAQLKAGFPVQAYAAGGFFRGGPAIHTLVGDIDDEPGLEILTTGLGSGPLYAWNADGTSVSGWPVVDLPGAAYPALGRLDADSPGLEVATGYVGIPGVIAPDLVARQGTGIPLDGWPRTSANYVAAPPGLADVDGDSIDEIFTEEEDGRLHAYRANGTPLTGWPTIHSLGGQGLRTPASADLDGDGTLEMVTVSDAISGVGFGGVYLYAFHRDGTLVAGFPVPVQSGYNDTIPAIGDVDGDGQLEIVVGTFEGSMSAHLSGVRVYSAAGVLERRMTAAGGVSYGTTPALADLDGDGTPEIVLQTDSAVDVWKGDGTSLPGWPVHLGFLGEMGYSAPVVGDLDGDQHPDIAFLRSRGLDGDVHVLRSNGTPLPGFPKTLNLGSGAMPAIADIDRDGRNELIVTGNYWDGYAGFYDKVWVYDLHGPAPYGPVEWGQFMGGPSHHGRYEPTPVSDGAYALTVASIGTGAGTFVSDPPGIDCGPDCNALLPADTAVSVTATPASGSLFTGWSGDCAGQGNPCQLVMHAGRTATAEFTAITVSVGDAELLEPYGGTLNVVFTVGLSAPNPLPVTVSFVTADGTAHQPADYSAVAGTVTFGPGEMSKTVSVPVKADINTESDETFSVNLSAPTNAILGDAVGIGTILDDEISSVMWTSLVGASAVVNDLAKTSGTSAWDAGAVSTRTIPYGNGSAGFVVSETTTYRIFGLSHGNTNASDSDVDFGFYLYADGTIRIKEGGVNRTAPGGSLVFGRYATGESLHFSVVGGVVRYYQNATLLYTSTVTPVFPLLIDTSLYSPGARITGAWIQRDSLPWLSLGDTSVVEGNSGTVTASVRLSLSPASGEAVTASYSISNGSAEGPADFTPSTGTVTFNPGETSKTIPVSVNGDTAVEPDETFVVALTGLSSNARFTNASVTGTILDDDGPAAVSATWTSLVAATASGNNLTRTGGTAGWNAGAVSVQTIPGGVGYVQVTANDESTYRIFGLSNGSTNATDSDIDFGMYLYLNEIRIKEGGVNRLNGSSPTFGTFMNGDRLRVAVDAGVVRYYRNFVLLYMSSVPATYPLLADTALYTPGASLRNAVIGVDRRPMVSINDATVTEGHTGTATATFTVALSAISPTTVTVDYATANGTATEASGDYVPATGSLTFMPGETSKTVSVTVNGDTTEEGNETFFVNLGNPSNTIVGDGQGQGTITNDDGPIVANVTWTSLVGVSATGNSLAKTAGTSAWDAGAVSTQTIAGGMTYAEFTTTETSTYRLFGLSNGNSNATESDVDFGIYLYLNEVRIKEGGVNRLNGPSASFGTFAAGDRFRVGVSGGVVRYSKNGVVFYTSATPPVFPLLVDTSFYTPGATVTNAVIVTDPRPLLTISDVSVTEGNAGTTPATFTVTLSAAAASTVTVDYTTANGTAVAPGDYMSGTGTLTFTAGETSKTITIDVAGDLLLESTETFTVNLTNASSNALIGDGQGVGSILDNDSPPVENVVWTSLVGASASGNNLTKTAATSAWDAGAVSTRALGPEDGYVELTASQPTTYRMIGLSNGNTNASDTDIDFALYLYGDGTIRIKEGGVSRFVSGSNPTFGTYVTGDHLRVAVEGGVVKYRKNGTLLYTSALVPVSPLLVDTSLWSPGATLNGVVISGNLQ